MFVAAVILIYFTWFSGWLNGLIHSRELMITVHGVTITNTQNMLNVFYEVLY